jgi:hypothetical protein
VIYGNVIRQPRWDCVIIIGFPKAGDVVASLGLYQATASPLIAHVNVRPVLGNGFAVFAPFGTLPSLLLRVSHLIAIFHNYTRGREG